MNIIDDLYYGNINISAHETEDGSEEQAALNASAEAQTKLADAIPEELKPLLDNLIMVNDTLLDVTSRRCFEQGFKYGMRFTVAGLKDDNFLVDSSDEK